MSIPQFHARDRPRRQDRAGGLGEHPAYVSASASERRTGEQLRMIHDNYRGGFVQVQQLLDGVVSGVGAVADVRRAIHDMGLGRAYQQLGSFCGQLCRAVESHHRIEDAHLYPALRAADRDGADLAAATERGGTSTVPFVRGYRLRLDELPASPTRADAVVAEAVASFAATTALFEALAALLGPVSVAS